MIPDIDTLSAQSIQTFPPNLDLRNDGQSFAAFSFAVYEKERERGKAKGEVGRDCEKEGERKRKRERSY